MTTGSSDLAGTQQAIDFLSSLETLDAARSELALANDYSTIVKLAQQSGFEFDETALRQAFAWMVRARSLSSPGRREDGS